MEKITGAKAWVWALAILVGVGGVVYGEMMRERAHTYKGYKESLATEMRNHREDMAACAKALKECEGTAEERAKIDRKTIEELIKKSDRLAQKLRIGKGANVTINVAP